MTSKRLMDSAGRALAFAGLAMVFSNCGGSEAKNGPTEAVSVEIEKFTGGPSKMVWSRHVGGGSGDVHLSYEKLQLWGIDTRDGKGIRQLLKVNRNYARPLITPDGQSIVFTSKGTVDLGRDKEGKALKEFNPVIFRTDWESGEAREVAEGYAVDVWRDPETGIDWVYAATLGETNRASLYAEKLERFQLEKPEVREPVWDKTRLSTENIQLSHDGKRASGMFPWPQAGVLNLDGGDHRINEHGCWPSLAPDNSYRAWVFDGAHKNLRMFDDSGEKQGRIPVNTAPALEGSEVYHPRWSNDVRFLTVTGPYKGATVSKSNSKEVEIFVGRFNKDFDEIAGWLQVTENEESDYNPDLWVASAATASASPAVAAAAPKKKKRRPWPVTTGRLLFLWEHQKSGNIVDQRNARPSSVIAREQARFGRHNDMLCDGGYFEADPVTHEAIEAHLGLPRYKFTLEIMATPFSADQDGTLLSTRAFQIQQRGEDLVLVSTRPVPSAFWFGKAEKDVPVHLGVIFDGHEFQIHHNGKRVSQKDRNPEPEMLASRTGLTFGEGWDGALEGISIVPGVLEDWRVERGADYLLAKLKDRQPVPRVRLKGKLVEMTPAKQPVSEGEDYRRALLAYLYEVEEVLEGEYKDEKVVVLHWTRLDAKPLQGFPRRPGRSYELIIEPIRKGKKEFHPELESERMWNNLSEFLDEWYDVATPQD